MQKSEKQNAASDARLVQQTLAGDQGAFAHLVARYRGLVSGIAYHYLSHYEDAQDVAQETFVQALLRLADLREPAKFAPWLRRATMNQCADRLRRQGLRHLSLNDLPEEAYVSAASCESEVIATRLLVREALARLPSRTRLTVTLHYMSGYSHEEIAHILEVPLNTVRSRLQTAKRKLREEINMVEIVNDSNNVSQSQTPNPQFARQVVEEALRRGDEAMQGYRKGDAARQYETALEALAHWQPCPEQRRLEMQALWQKGRAAAPYRSGNAQAILLFERALEIARELGDVASEADKLQHLAQTYFNTNQPEYASKITIMLEKAEAIYLRLGDALHQGQCRRFLGEIHLQERVARGKRDYEAALQMFVNADAPQDAAYCRAFLSLLAEVGEARFTHGLIGRYVGVDGLKAQNGWVAHVFENCRIDYTWQNTPEETLLRQSRVFWQIGQLHPFLDARVGVGASWSKPAASYSQQPLQATATVLSDAETITTLSGTFVNCRLIEYVTTETEPAEAAPEEGRAGNREEFCGTRRAWYAPGVGIVRLHIVSATGDETTMELQEYAIEEAGDQNTLDFLPLAIGNRWVYGWVGAGPEYVAREVYTVASQTHSDPEPGIWCLEHYAYVYKHE